MLGIDLDEDYHGSMTYEFELWRMVSELMGISYMKTKPDCPCVYFPWCLDSLLYVLATKRTSLIPANGSVPASLLLSAHRTIFSTMRLPAGSSGTQ